jgi:hypothetical protein
MTKLVTRCVVVSIGAAVALLPQLASAQEAPPQEKKEEAGASASASLSGGLSGEGRAEADHPAGEAEEKEEEGRLSLGVDMVIGFGKTPIVTELLPGSLATVPEHTVAQSRITTESFILGGEYELTHSIGIGARLPFTFGSFSPEGAGSRSTTALGSLEVEGVYTLHLNEKMKLVYALGVSLPTAQGDEVPSGAELEEKYRGQTIDQNNFDRFSVNKAASSSRAFEESALFEPKRLGFIPKVMFDYNANKILLQPYVKMENLVSTVSGAEHSYIGELILGAFAGYRVLESVDAGVRVWTNVAFAGGGDTVAAVEPQLRGHFGPIMPVVGGIIPFAGLTNPQYGGVRVAVAARF